MSGYFNLELNPDMMPVKAVHTLNRPYKGAVKHRMRAPDADGELVVYARCEEEARDHLVNALFDLVFRGARLGVTARNPACLFCGGKTQRGGRNSAGKRVWKCQNLECRRSFVLDRTFKGGINHPSQSKKPAFVRLLTEGKTVAEAADLVGVCLHTAGNWAEKAEAMGILRGVNCPCGRPVRHRGSCAYRMSYRRDARGRMVAKEGAAA